MATTIFRKFWKSRFLSVNSKKNKINEKQNHQTFKTTSLKKENRNLLISVDNGKFYNFKNKKRIHFLKNKLIFFFSVKVETDLRVW